MPPSREEDLKAVLKENNHTKYFMLVREFRTNHLAHAAVAIHRLGGDKKRIQRYIEANCVGKLESPDGKSAKMQLSEEENVDKLLGAHQNYHILLKYYQEKFEKEYKSDLTKFVQEEYEKLADGPMTAAFHGLIQIAYGYVADAPFSVYEGFAYLHHSFLPLGIADKQIQIGRGTKNVIKVLEEFRDDGAIKEFMESHLPPGKDRENIRFSERVKPLLSERGDALLEYVKQIKLPVDVTECTMDDVGELAKWVVHCAVVVFAKSKHKNEFFLLHGVTGAWSLQQVLKTYKDPIKALLAIQTFFCCLLAAYRAQTCPALTTSLDPEKLKYKTWSDIIAATLASDFDAHVFKLVQVVHELALDGSNSDHEEIYKAAANLCLENKLYNSFSTKFIE